MGDKPTNMTGNPLWLQGLSVIFRREPKTPMAFCNRMLWVVIATIVAPLYSNIDPKIKPWFVATGALMGVGVFGWVQIFSWKKPDHLLYGAEIHFEKWKTAFGTDKGPATSTDLKNTSGNPQA